MSLLTLIITASQKETHKLLGIEDGAIEQEGEEEPSETRTQDRHSILTLPRAPRVSLQGLCHSEGGENGDNHQNGELDLDTKTAFHVRNH